MWSNREQDKSLSKRPSGSDAFAEGAIGAVTGLAVIGKAMVIHGQIRSRESLHIDGQVDGTLDLPDSRLTIGAQARVDADVTAREVEVLGSVTGDVDATKKITIRKGGRLVGDLRTPGIVIEEGAYFKGRIEIINPEPEIVVAPSQAEASAGSDAQVQTATASTGS